MRIRGMPAAVVLLVFSSPAVGQSDIADRRADDTSEYLSRADDLFKAGRYEETVETLVEALRQRPGWAEAYNSLCVVEATLGRHEEALRHCRRASDIRPRYASPHYNLGNIYDRLGRDAEAVEAFEQAVRLSPDYAIAYYGLGTARAELGRDGDALKALEEAVRLKPDFAAALVGLSGLYYKTGRYGEALAAASRLVGLKPDSAEAHENLGVIHNGMGAFAEAADALTRSVRLKPRASAFIHLGYALGKLGRLEKAATAFKRATLLQPDHAVARYNLGIVSLDLRLKAEARAQYRRLVELDSGLARKLYREIHRDKLLDVSRGVEPR